MSDEMTALRGRQDNLEERMERLETTVGREAIPDHTIRLTRIEDRVVNVEDRLEIVQGRLEIVEDKLGIVHLGVHAIIDLLDTHLVRKPRFPALPGLLRRPRPQE